MLANREPYEADAFCPGCWICEITSLRPNTPCALGSGATRPGIITRACEHGPGGKSSGPAPPWSRLTCSTAGQHPPAPRGRGEASARPLAALYRSTRAARCGGCKAARAEISPQGHNSPCCSAAAVTRTARPCSCNKKKQFYARFMSVCGRQCLPFFLGRIGGKRGAFRAFRSGASPADLTSVWTVRGSLDASTELSDMKGLDQVQKVRLCVNARLVRDRESEGWGVWGPEAEYA